ncbi:inhibitor of apoptosis-promoting Bax1-domain-containing protein [Mycena crocata]|nr:inhibitor of apoptosis-promoting Bax1-domain-containing protein [Mycena crocata]
MSQYSVPPPSYGTYAKGFPESTPLEERSRSAETEPLLASSGGSVSDQPTAQDLPDDFKYGTTVSDCAPQVRKAFIRKVYTILLTQILATVLVGGFFSQSKPTLEWVTSHLWAFFVPLGGTIVNLGLLYWKRHTHPWNLILLSTFTIAEAFTLGIAVAFYDNMVVLQALLITLAVFIGLTLFTLQSKYDFSGMGPFLFAALIVLCMTSVVHFLVAPFNRAMDVLFTVGGCIVFSACVVYDTYRINRRLSPDEFIMGAISLYLE